MRVLVAFPFPVTPEGGAAARCGIGLLRGLLDAGLDVEALAADSSGRAPVPPPADLPVEVVPVDHPDPLQHRVERLVRPYSWLARGPFGTRVAERSERADVVHLVGLEAGELLRRVRRPALAQLDCFTRHDRDVGRPWTVEGRTAIELLRAERRTARRARWLLASSAEVAAGFRSLAPGTEVVTAPLALDPAHYRPRAALAAPVAGLIGTARWPPTANAVERLLRSVWPRVLRLRPDARIRLAGRGMAPAAFPGLPTDLPGVEWVGEVESATGFLRELGLLCYPLGRGSGAKIKVLESLALGLPVVTTPAGAEGVVGTGGLSVHVDDEGLAAATAALLADAEARRASGAAAADAFVAGHAPAPAAAPVVELYDRMAAAR
ncbi:MAG: glycosyltransferase family 4 protein [Solirubrobacterales bacterium]|nr:glycosyltransferase family 4 protein [Solirubrobacterales bacterium]